MESEPPQFAVELVSSAGLRLVLDQLVRGPGEGVLVAKVCYEVAAKESDAAPKGVRLPLGSMKVGVNRLEVHLSPAPGEPYAKVQTIELTAK